MCHAQHCSMFSCAPEGALQAAANAPTKPEGSLRNQPLSTSLCGSQWQQSRLLVKVCLVKDLAIERSAC